MESRNVLAVRILRTGSGCFNDIQTVALRAVNLDGVAPPAAQPGDGTAYATVGQSVHEKTCSALPF